jgi:hypothetical protein
MISSTERVQWTLKKTNKINDMKYFTSIATVGSLAVVALIATSPDAQAKKKAAASPAASTSPTATASPSASPGTKMVRMPPFHGMISAVDSRAKTFTIAGKNQSHVFKITDQSVITKAGAAATMKDVVEKEEVRGNYWKEADGTLMAKTVKVGPLTEQEKAAEAARKQKRVERKAAKAAAAASASASASGSASPAPSAAASATPKP